MRVLYDGWSLIHQPNEPPAMHLLAVLARLPKEFESIVALPGPAPDWLPEIEFHTKNISNTPWGRLRWEQHALPGLLKETGAQLLHLFSLHSPLLNPSYTVVSPTGLNFNQDTSTKIGSNWGIVSKLRESVGQGGLSLAKAILWPSDLPEPTLPIPVMALPPCVHPDFTFQSGLNGSKFSLIEDLGLPETFILYHGPLSDLNLQHLLSAWSWAAGPIGAYYPLIILGIGAKTRERLGSLLEQYDLENTVKALPVISPSAIPAIYATCTTLFHPAPVPPWGGPVRQALACGKPVVSMESDLIEAMVGSGAYLVSGQDTRQLGAALITTVVEDSVAESLTRAAKQQSNSWQSHSFAKELSNVYHNLIS